MATIETAPIDTSKTIEILQSPAKMLGLVGLGIVMTGLSALIALGYISERSNDSFVVAIGWFGTAFFGLCVAIALWRLLTLRGPAVTLSPHGLKDIRVARETVPWTAVREISTWSYQGQRILIVTLDPEVEAKIGLTAMARMTRGPNRALGADGLAINAQGLAIGHDRLVSLVDAYTAAHGARQ